MKASGQPRSQPGLCRGQIDPSHTDLRESEFTGPFPNRRHELMIVPERPALHPAIVESTVWHSQADTQAFAGRLARALLALPHPGDALIELHGDLGAGKTTLARHVLQALGVGGRIKSPTYTVLETYQVPIGQSQLSLSHLDFYRFNDPQEWEEAGLRDLFAAPGLKLVEWPERAAGLLPPADLRIFICSTPWASQDDAPRQVRLEAWGPTGAALAAAVA